MEWKQLQRKQEKKNKKTEKSGERLEWWENSFHGKRRTIRIVGKQLQRKQKNDQNSGKTVTEETEKKENGGEIVTEETGERGEWRGKDLQKIIRRSRRNSHTKRKQEKEDNGLEKN